MLVICAVYIASSNYVNSTVVATVSAVLPPHRNLCDWDC